MEEDDALGTALLLVVLVVALLLAWLWWCPCGRWGGQLYTRMAPVLIPTYSLLTTKKF